MPLTYDSSMMVLRLLLQCWLRPVTQTIAIDDADILKENKSSNISVNIVNIVRVKKQYVTSTSMGEWLRMQKIASHLVFVYAQNLSVTRSPSRPHFQFTFFSRREPTFNWYNEAGWAVLIMAKYVNSGVPLLWYQCLVKGFKGLKKKLLVCSGDFLRSVTPLSSNKMF